MGQLRVFQVLVSLLVLSTGSRALAQVAAPGAHQPLPGSTAASLDQVQRWFELEAPFSRQLKLRFDTRPVPTFETLRLPTFESRATLWQKGSLSLSLFEHVAPTLELDCTLTCAPLLERSIGFDARANLGQINKQIPSTFLFIRPEMVRMGRGFLSRTMLGLGGMLDL